jgi:hypothetical protein
MLFVRPFTVLLLAAGLTACAAQEPRSFDPTPTDSQLRDIKECEAKLASLPDFAACMQEKGYRRIDMKNSLPNRLI